MTLDNFIETLNSLKNHYNANDFDVKINTININNHTNKITNTYYSYMDGDNFRLNLDKKILEIDNKFNFE